MKTFRRHRLVCPGPTPLLDEAQLAPLNKNIYHRSASFKRTVIECRQMLKEVFLGEHLPLILTCSGTGAMESAVVNFTDESDAVGIISGGKFGDRWSQVCHKYQCDTNIMSLNWGESVDIESLDKWLQSLTNLKAFFFQANETSTGVALPVASIASTVRRYFPDCIITVDAISGLLAQKLNQTELDVDVLISGSQKGFGLPAGLAFVSLSTRAIKSFSNRDRFYFDLEKELEGQKSGTTCWTPATSLILSLHTTLDTIIAIGLDEFVNKHILMAKACRAAATALGLELLPTRDFSTSLTAIKVPESVDGMKLLQILSEKYNSFFAGGQNELKGKIVRIAHLGFVDEFDLIQNLSIFEFALKDMNYKFEMGAGVSEAMRVLHANM